MLILIRSLTVALALTAGAAATSAAGTPTDAAPALWQPDVAFFPPARDDPENEEGDDPCDNGVTDPPEDDPPTEEE